MNLKCICLLSHLVSIYFISHTECKCAECFIFLVLKFKKAFFIDPCKRNLTDLPQ